MQYINIGCSKSLSKGLDVKLILVKLFFSFCSVKVAIFSCEIFFFFRSWTKTKKCQHKSQIFPLCLASVVPHLRYCLFSFCYHSHSLLWLSFPTGSPEWILWFLWFGCSLLLLLERWPQQNNRNTAENQCKQKKEEASHPKSHISGVLPVQYFSYNLCEKLKTFCGQHMYFEKGLIFPVNPGH